MAEINKIQGELAKEKQKNAKLEGEVNVQKRQVAKARRCEKDANTKLAAMNKQLTTLRSKLKKVNDDYGKMKTDMAHLKALKNTAVSTPHIWLLFLLIIKLSFMAHRIRI